MVVVAIIAVLAAIVVPTFTTESKKSKAKSEVGAMFAELAVREEQYKLENGSYLEAAACPPGAPASTPRDIASCTAASQPWDLLRVHAPSVGKDVTKQELYCTYEITTNLSASTTPPAWGGFTPPGSNVSWFFILATCDMDSNGVTSQYFASSENPKIVPHNDGN